MYIQAFHVSPQISDPPKCGMFANIGFQNYSEYVWNITKFSWIESCFPVKFLFCEMSKSGEAGFVNQLSRLTDRIPGATAQNGNRISDTGVRMTTSPGEIEEYEQFLSSTKALWTLIDQQRLLAMDSLYKRMLEYHNNIHVKDTSLNPILTGEGEDNHELMVAQAIKFSTDKLEKPYSVTCGELSGFCLRMKNEVSKDPNGVLWIHLRDLIALPTIARAFDMHELISAGFQDLRAHSTFIPAFTEALVTTVTCMRENNDFNMYKMYIYIAEKIIITFQAELLPDIMDPELSSPDKLVNHLFENYIQLRQRCLKYGAPYLLYEIALQSLRGFDSAMEFISYSLSYFNKVVHLRLLHRERLAILVKMHMIASGIRFFKDIVSEGSSNIRTFVSTAFGSFDSKPSGMGILLQSNVIKEHHIPYLMDLLDSFEFVLTSMNHQMEESQRLDEKLDSTMQLRATNTSIVLSLVATIFLPLTFFAGIYGMNFSVDGGFTIGMLNDPDGPVIFYWMCAGSALASIAFFVAQGWLDISFLGRMVSCLGCSSKIDDSLVDEDEQAAALTRAKEEEERRQEEADARRSFQSATRNVERINNFRASNMGMGMRPTFSNSNSPNRSVEGSLNPILGLSSASSTSPSLPPGTIVIKRRRMSTMATKLPDANLSESSSRVLSLSPIGEDTASQLSESIVSRNSFDANSVPSTMLPQFRESMSNSNVGGTSDLI